MKNQLPSFSEIVTEVAEKMAVEQPERDAESFEIWKAFGFSDEQAFEFVVTQPIRREKTIEELLKFFS